VTRCPTCQHENAAGLKFCGECGARLMAACPSCGAANPPTQKFCGECGTRLAQEPASPRLAAAPVSYTPRHLAEKILTSRSVLEGERKLVTVLFADLKGSMELLADRDPEEARKLLDPVLERMMEAVHHYEGTVNQVMGDGVMALFGAPVAHEDHAVRACYAALRMQESLKRYTDDTRRSHGVEVQIRVGLNSGEVVVRAVGSDLRMDYTAVGQTTHLAARMEQLAPPGTVRLTGETVRLAEGYVEVRSLGPIPVKGLADPIEIFELTGAGAARTRLQAAAIRGLTRFVGRDAEVEHLRRVLGQAGAGRGQVVASVGEAGVGKSRLVYEFTHSHRVQDWLILEASSVSYGKATSYLPVIDLLKGYFKIGDRDDHRAMRDKVLGRVLGLDRALEPLLPPLLALLDVPVDDPTWQVLDPPQRRQRTLDAVKRVLLRESQAQPLLVVFEDLHWIDGETQAVLDSLVEGLASACLLLLTSYRPEYEHRWGSKTYYSQLRLDSLPAESTAELLGALAGDDPGLEPLRGMLAKRGNPFFLEETVRTLVETGALVGERGAYRLARPIDLLQIPATVQAILAARIDRLPPEEKQLLQAASVIGKDVPSVILAAIADQPEEGLRRGLAHLQEAEFLYETSLFPDLEYTFKHALTHEVTYGGLLSERRRRLHARIVEETERLYGDRTAEHIERLGHHALRGELWEKAVRFLRQAAAKAFGRSAYLESVACLKQALAALDHLPETRETLEQAIDLRFEVRNPLFALGHLESGLQYVSEADALARKLHDQRRLGWASVYTAHHLWMTGRATQAGTFGKNALAIAETLGEFSLRVAANLYLGAAGFISGDYRTAEQLLRHAMQLSDDLSRERRGLVAYPAVISRAFLAWTLAHLGRFEEGVACGRDGIRLAETIDHPYSLVGVCANLAWLYGFKGELSEALHLCQRGLALARERALTLWLPFCEWAMGYHLLQSGPAAEGRALMEQALEGIESMGFGGYQPLLLVHLGEACLLENRLDEASAFGQKALTLSREHQQRGHEAYALRLQGEIAAHRDPAAAGEADARYGEARATAEDLGMRPLVAHCYLGLGKLYRRTGQRDQAQEHLTTATMMYREMDMRLWLEKAEAEMTKAGG